MQPTLRKPFGVIGLIAWIVVYALVVAKLAEPINALNALLQLPIWAVLGVAWIIPVKPLLQWMETGHWRPPAA